MLQVLAIGLRENKFIPYLKEHINSNGIQVFRTIDPTLLLTTEDYDTIAASRIITEKYLLLYARRYNKEMEAFAEKIARDNGWTIVEISLRSTNSAKGHKMFYEAGIEEFLSLVKYSERMPSHKSTFSNSTNPRLRCCACTYKYCKKIFSGLSHERT